MSEKNGIDCVSGTGKDCGEWWSGILSKVLQILNADIGAALAAYTDKEMTGVIVWNRKLSADEGLTNEKGGRGMNANECVRSRNVLRSGVAVLTGSQWERMKMPEKSSCVSLGRNYVSSLFVSSLFYVGEIAVLHDLVAEYSSGKEKEEERKKLLVDAFVGVEEIKSIFGNISNAFSEEMSDEQAREQARRYLERSGEILKCICSAFWAGSFESSLQWARAADLKVDELMTEICFDFTGSGGGKP